MEGESQLLFIGWGFEDAGWQVCTLSLSLSLSLSQLWDFAYNSPSSDATLPFWFLFTLLDPVETSSLESLTRLLKTCLGFLLATHLVISPPILLLTCLPSLHSQPQRTGDTSCSVLCPQSQWTFIKCCQKNATLHLSDCHHADTVLH
jgi:hypothetical protein